MAKSSGGGGFSIGKGRGDSATSFEVSRGGLSATVSNVSGDRWQASFRSSRGESTSQSAYTTRENAISWARNTIRSRGG